MELTREIKELKGDKWTFKRSVKAYNHLTTNTKTLDQCYNNCSYYKENAFRECEHEIWSIMDKYNLHSDYSYWGIASYNIMQFTFQALLYNDKYYIIIYITKTYNYFDIRER